MDTLVANFVEPRATPPTDMIAPSAGPEAVQSARGCYGVGTAEQNKKRKRCHNNHHDDAAPLSSKFVSNDNPHAASDQWGSPRAAEWCQQCGAGASSPFPSKISSSVESLQDEGSGKKVHDIMDWLLQDIMHKYGLTLQPKCCNSNMCFGKCKNKNTRTVEKINWPLVEAIKVILESSSNRMNDVVGTDDEDGIATADNSMMTDDVAEYVGVGSDSIHVSFDAIDVESCRGDSNDDMVANDVGMASDDDESGASSVLDNNSGASEAPHPSSLPTTSTSTLSVEATTTTLSLDAMDVEACRGDSNGDVIANDVGSTTMAPEWTSTNATDAPLVQQPRGEQNSHPNVNNGKTNQNRKKKASPKNQPAQLEALTWSLLGHSGRGGKREQALVAIKTRFNLALGGTRIDTNEGKELLELLRFRKELVSKGSAEGVSIPPQYATHYTQLEKLRAERDGITSSEEDAKKKHNSLSQKISRSNKNEDARICELAVQCIENGLSDNEEGTTLAALLQEDYEKCKSKTNASMCKRFRDKTMPKIREAQARLDEFEANSDKSLPGYSEKHDELAKEAEEWKSKSHASRLKRSRDNVVVYQDGTGTVIRRKDIFPSSLDLSNALASLTPVSGSSPSVHSRKRTGVYLDGYTKQKPCDETVERMKKIR